MPFTNAGGFLFNVEEETKYGRTQGDIVIGGHVESREGLSP